MDKTLLKITLFFAAILSLFSFIGCKNFFSGGSFLEELEYSIADLNASPTDIYIEADTNSGVISPSGKISTKVGRTFSVIFQESNDYQFLYWDIIDRNTRASVSNAIEILETNGNETIFKLVASQNDLTVYPVCAERLKASFYPELSEKGVERDSSIVITFNKILDSQNNLDEILITSENEDAKQLYYNTPVLTDNILTFTVNKESLIPVTSTRVVTVSIPETFYYKSGDYNVTVGKQINYSFKLNRSTDEKAEITVSVLPDNGTVIPNGTNKYNIDDEIGIIYSPKVGIDFRGWNIVDGNGETVDSADIEIKEKQEYKTTVVVHKGIKGVVISPNCVLIPTYTNLFPPPIEKGIISTQDSDIVVSFNTKVRLSDFYDSTSNTFKNIQIICENTNIILGQTAEQRFKYFNPPRLSEDEMILTIPTNKDNTIMPVPDEGTPPNLSKNISVKLFTEGITTKDENISFGKNIEWTYTINNGIDKEAPKIELLEVYKDKDLNYLLCNDSFDDVIWAQNNASKIHQNHVSKLYVKVQARDSNGIKSLVIKEKGIRNIYGEDISAISSVIGPTKFQKDTNNNTFKYNSKTDLYEAVIPVTFSRAVEDGVEKITLFVSDYAGNNSSEYTYYVIKDTYLNENDICPSEESHEILENFYSDIFYFNNQTNCLKYSKINDEFVREPNGTNDTVILDFSDLTETFYNNIKGNIFVKEVLWGYSENESEMNKAEYDEKTKKFSFTRDKTKNTYLIYKAEDESGSQNKLVRVIPHNIELLAVLSSYNINLYPTIQNSKYGNIGIPYIEITQYDDLGNIAAKYNCDEYGFIFIFKNTELDETNLSYFVFPDIKNNSPGGKSDKFSFNPYNDGSLLSTKESSLDYLDFYKGTTSSRTQASVEDYVNYMPNGVYDFYVVPYINFFERTYFGSRSDALKICKTNVYENGSTEGKKYYYKGKKETEEEEFIAYPNSSKPNYTTETAQAIFPKKDELIINITPSEKGSGNCVIEVLFKDSFIPKPDYEYFIFHNLPNKLSTNNKIILPCGKNYKNLRIGAKYGDTEYVNNYAVEVDCTGIDTICPSFVFDEDWGETENNSWGYRNTYSKNYVYPNGFRIFNANGQYIKDDEPASENSTTFLPNDTSGMKTDTYGNASIDYYFIYLGNEKPDDNAIRLYSYDELKNYEKKIINYKTNNLILSGKTKDLNPDIRLLLPYDGLEEGYYELLMQAEDIYENKKTTYGLICNKIVNNELKYEYNQTDETIIFSEATEDIQLVFCEFINENNMWEYARPVLLEKDFFYRPLYQCVYPNQIADFPKSSKISSKKFKSGSFNISKEGKGNRFLKINLSNEGITSYTKYIYPDYYNTSYSETERKTKYPCKKKSFVYTSSIEPEIVVYADSPVLVHTLWCSKNLADPKNNPDAALIWGSKAQDVEGSAIQEDMDFTYEIPVEKIEKGKWYTTIMHYADGTTKMTQPIQK